MLLLSLSACGFGRPDVPVTATLSSGIGKTPLQTPTSAQAMLSAGESSPLPTPTPDITVQEKPTPHVTPTYQPLEIVPELEEGKGAIRGRLTWDLGKEKLVPATHNTIYLGKVLFDDKGEPWLFSFDVENYPKTKTDGGGRFVFSNLEPDTYTLYYTMEGFSEFLLEKPDEDKFMIEVKTGETVDMDDFVALFPSF
ncbi:MAG: hypothetical protein B6242_01935 [Anaerolineaceae bacterium 4572_78]|nr:MAG: hypothetical protein B6242_01935 [Anaerolineaceae bacterium 4572_78]